MKRLSSLIALIAIAAVTFYMSSCKKDPVYSCDKGINNYAKENLIINQSISREDLAQLGVDTQFAVFNSLSPSNKARIFHEKIALLLADEDITQADKNHLEQLNDNITEELYSNGNGEENPYIISWKNKAINNLHWDEQKLIMFVGTWLSPDEFAHYDPLSNESGAPPKSNCKCNSRFACGFGLYSCKTGSCAETVTGCGIAGSMPCKGTCDY